MTYHWSFGKDPNFEKFCERSTIRYDKIDYGVMMDLQKKALYRKWCKLSALIENYIMGAVRSPSPKIYDYYVKNIFLNMLSNTFSDFISDMGVTD